MSGQAKHTSGPWFIADGGVCASDCPADGANVICLEPEAPMKASLAKWPENARLIAAAPELLGAHEDREGDLVMLRKAIEAGDPMAELFFRIDDMLRETRAVIAKARGQ